MPGRTTIEWATDTWNPLSGCTKVSRGCKYCYAKRLWPRVYPGREFEDVQLHADRLDQPLRWKRPRRIFVNSMSDLFHEDVPFEFLDRVFEIVRSTPRHTYQVLTKRPERAVGYSLWSERNTSGGWRLPGNVWIGVSMEDQETAEERIPQLLSLPAAVRFLSVEPMLGPVDLDRGGWSFLRPLRPPPGNLVGWGRGVDWVICGGESGPSARPMAPAWARALRDQCVGAGVPFFFKQWGEWAPAGQVPVDCDISIARPLHAYVAGVRVARYGKRMCGRQLDGRTWDELP